MGIRTHTHTNNHNHTITHTQSHNHTITHTQVKSMFEKVHQLTSATCGPPKGIVFDGYANGDIIFTQVPVSPYKLMNIRNVDASRCGPSFPAAPF